MLYLSQEDQIRIQRRVRRLPDFLSGQNISIFIFECVSTLILSYGICISAFLHPIKSQIADPCADLYISCFFYFAISVAAPFTGAHINPAVSIAANSIKTNKNILTYIIAQITGAMIGAGLFMAFQGLALPPYSQVPTFADFFLDMLGEVVGTMIFIFMILYVTQTNYSSGEYFGYLIISIMLLMGRTFTFRLGCVNPAIGFAFQFMHLFQHFNLIELVSCISIIVGPITGGLIAAYIFKNFYKPLLQEIQYGKHDKDQ